MTIGQLIKQMRKSAKLSQKQLADMLGVSASMIGQYENNLRKPKIETLNRIADALGTSITLNIDKATGDVRYALFENGIRPQTAPGDNILIGTHLVKIQETETLSNDALSRFDQWESMLLERFSRLNIEGQQKAIERVEELTEIPKYQKKPPQD